MWIYADTQGLINTDHIEQVQASTDPMTVAVTLASGREFFLAFDTEEKRNRVMHGLIEKLDGLLIADL